LLVFSFQKNNLVLAFATGQGRKVLFRSLARQGGRRALDERAGFHETTSKMLVIKRHYFEASGEAVYKAAAMVLFVIEA
jgi:hypothetical protein